MNINEYLPTKAQVSAIVLYGVTGALLGRIVCKFSWKDAALWSTGAAVLNHLIVVPRLNSLGRLINRFADNNIGALHGNDSKGVRGNLAFAGVLVSVGMLNCITNKAASYLIRVPSNLFTIIAAPVLLVGSLCIARRIIR